jgi:hypothetical protein
VIGPEESPALAEEAGAPAEADASDVPLRFEEAGPIVKIRSAGG